MSRYVSIRFALVVHGGFEFRFGLNFSWSILIRFGLVVHGGFEFRFGLNFSWSSLYRLRVRQED
jgi:hypothetical protein